MQRLVSAPCARQRPWLAAPLSQPATSQRLVSAASATQRPTAEGGDGGNGIGNGDGSLPRQKAGTGGPGRPRGKRPRGGSGGSGGGGGACAIRQGSDSSGRCFRCGLQHPGRDHALAMSDAAGAGERSSGDRDSGAGAAALPQGSNARARRLANNFSERVARRWARAELQQQLLQQDAQSAEGGWHRVRGLVAYSGAGLHGFQRQNIGGWVMPTVQTMLEECLARAFGLLAAEDSLLGLRCAIQSESFATMGPRWGATPPLVVAGASRTDTGVGAERQVIHFDLLRRPSESEVAAAVSAANAELGRAKASLGLLYSIRVVALENVPEGGSFWSQRQAAGKRYCYTVFDGAGDPPALPAASPQAPPATSLQFVELNPPALRRHRPESVRRLDDAKMHALAQQFQGPAKNFRLFSHGGYKGHAYVRSVSRARVFRTALPVNAATRRSVTFDDEHDPQGDFVHFVVEGPGFLYLMVRCMVTALLLVGEGTKQPADVLAYCFDPPTDKRALQKLQFSPAYAHGLVLGTVIYDKPEAKGQDQERDVIFGDSLLAPDANGDGRTGG